MPENITHPESPITTFEITHFIDVSRELLAEYKTSFSEVEAGNNHPEILTDTLLYADTKYTVGEKVIEIEETDYGWINEVKVIVVEPIYNESNAIDAIKTRRFIADPKAMTAEYQESITLIGKDHEPPQIVNTIGASTFTQSRLMEVHSLLRSCDATMPIAA